LDIPHIDAAWTIIPGWIGPHGAALPFTFGMTYILLELAPMIRTASIISTSIISTSIISTSIISTSIISTLILIAALGQPVAAEGLSQEEKDDGYVSLFNGQDLTGWIGAVEGYGVEDGAIVCIPEKGGNLYTEKEYSDFILKFEFKLSEGANNGLGIRAPLQGDAAYVGMELQILDDTAEVYANLQPYQYHGSIYGVVACERGHQNPVGEWNEQTVTCLGRRVKVELNGATIVDADLDEASRDGTIDGGQHPGLKNETGHIGFLGHGHRVEFRHLRLKDLSTGR
jgi:hypothetical protein